MDYRWEVTKGNWAFSIVAPDAITAGRLAEKIEHPERAYRGGWYKEISRITRQEEIFAITRTALTEEEKACLEVEKLLS